MKLSDFLGGSKSTITQEPMQTEEQKKMMQMLSQFAQTGSWGDSGYTAGQEYGGAMGNYNMSPIESQAQNSLLSMLSGGMGTFGLAKDEITKLLGSDKYDPYSDKGIYSGFAKNVDREAGETSDAMKTNMAITGDLFSTENARQHGLLAERTHDTKTNKLAELYDTFAQRKLAGAGMAAEMGAQEMNMLGMAQQMGALERMLKDQQAKEKYAAWQNQRNEFTQAIEAAQGVFNKDVPYGVKSYTASSPSPFSTILNSVLGAAGTAIGGPIGGMVSSGIGSMFTRQPTTTQPTTTQRGWQQDAMQQYRLY